MFEKGLSHINNFDQMLNASISHYVIMYLAGSIARYSSKSFY